MVFACRKNVAPYPEKRRGVGLKDGSGFVKGSLPGISKIVKAKESAPLLYKEPRGLSIHEKALIK